jgi:hypothetical protein
MELITCTELINDNINMYFDNIPTFNDQNILPTINVSINDVQLNALIDSGSVKCLITHNAIIKSGLNHMLDKNTITTNYGIGTVNSCGRIWYTNITFNDNLTLPVSFDSICNIYNNIDIVLGYNFISEYCDYINLKKNIISIMDNNFHFIQK